MVDHINHDNERNILLNLDCNCMMKFLSLGKCKKEGKAGVSEIEYGTNLINIDIFDAKVVYLHQDKI